MSDIVESRGRPIPFDDDAEFVENLARFADGTLSEAAVKAKYHLTEADWTALAKNDSLVERIEAAKIRRIRTGATKRERAQIEIIDGPPILGSIMRDTSASPRHRVDAAKALDQSAANGPEDRQPSADRFVITINLGASKQLHFDKPLRPIDAKASDLELNKIDANDTDPDDVDPLPWMMLTNKREGGSGEPV